MPRLIRFVVFIALALGATVAVSPSAFASGTTYTWLGQRDGVPGSDTHDWTNPLNWSPTGVPGNGDSVMAIPPATATGLHIDTVPGQLSLVNLTLADSGDTTTNDLARVSLQDGSITVTGHLSWTGGQLLTPVTIAQGATGTIIGGHNDSAEISTTLAVYGALTLSGVTNTESVSIDNPNTLLIETGGALISQGTNTITAGCCIDPSHVVNHGSIRAAGGTLRLTSVQFDQDNEIVFDHGNVVTDSAPFNAAAGGRYSGTGTWAIEDNSGQKVTLTGTQTLGSHVTLALRATTKDAEVAVGGHFTLAGTGTFLWANGTVEGTATIGHGVTVKLSGGPRTGNSARVLQGLDYTGTGDPTRSTFTNHGRLILADRAQLNTSSAARLVNASDGTISAAAGTAIVAEACCLSPDSIVNAGTFTVAANTAKQRVSLILERFRQTAGILSIPRNATLAVSLGAVAIAGGQVTGSGTIKGSVTNTGGRIRPGGGATGTLAITGSYAQTGKGTFEVDQTSTKQHDALSVGATANIKSHIAVVNHGATPTAGATRTVLSAKTLHLAPSCTTTTGSGSARRHWVATIRAGRYLRLVSTPGARTHC